MKSRAKCSLILILVCSISGCVSTAARVAPRLPAEYRVVGETKGGACGLLLFGLIPIGVNSRTERAYSNALGGKGTALSDTRIQYSWWIIPYVGLLLCTGIEGTVVR